MCRVLNISTSNFFINSITITLTTFLKKINLVIILGTTFKDFIFTGIIIKFRICHFTFFPLSPNVVFIISCPCIVIFSIFFFVFCTIYSIVFYKGFVAVNAIFWIKSIIFESKKFNTTA